jgi:hypothetical protein
LIKRRGLNYRKFMTINELEGFKQIIIRLPPIERTIHKWVYFDGRKVEILGGKVDGIHYYYDVGFDRGDNILSARDINPTTTSVIQDYMHRKGIFEIEEGTRRIHQELIIPGIERAYHNKIPLLNSDGQIDYLDVRVIHEWEYTTNKGKKIVSLLKKTNVTKVGESDQSYLWRFTLGKVHTLVEGQFKVVCRFPKANTYYPVNVHWFASNGYPVSWPRMMENLEADFLKDHTLEEIEEIAEHTLISFKPIYQKERSKFNPDVIITPYEWGVTLISYHTTISADFPIQFGHAAVVIEMVENGEYRALQAHVCHWMDHLGVKSPYGLRVVLTEAGAKIPVIGADGKKVYEIIEKKKVEKKEYHYLKDYSTNNLKDLYEDLSHSRVWIRKKDTVENMLSHIRSMKENQDRLKRPSFWFNHTGQHADSYAHAKIGGAFAAVGICAASWPVAAVGLGFMVSADKKIDRDTDPERKSHNCLSWTIEMLKYSDITIREGLDVQKYIAHVPKIYAQSYLEALEDSDHAYTRMNWQKLLRDQISISDGALNEVFVGGAFGIPRRNYFVKEGIPDRRIRLKTERLINTQFLGNFNYRSYVKYSARQLMLNARPTGIRFNTYEYSRFVEPLMERIIKNGDLSKNLIRRMTSIKAHLDIKDLGSCEIKEDYLIEPKTYYDTVERILAQVLRIELSEKMLWSMQFSKLKSCTVVV